MNQSRRAIDRGRRLAPSLLGLALLTLITAACQKEPTSTAAVQPAVTGGVTLMTPTSPPPPTEPPPTPTATLTLPPTATAPPATQTPPPDPIHAADWHMVIGGETSTAPAAVIIADVRLIDLTGDGADEAVISVGSGGTAGTIALYVYTNAGGRLLRLLVRREPAIAARIEGRTLIAVVPAFGPEDPRCCPSFIKRTTYRWTGTALEEAQTQLLPNPDR